MNILLLGSGGREHALAWKMKQSPLLKNLFIAPGNAGTSNIGKNVSLDIKNFELLKSFCLEQKIDMVIVGPEEPLVLGIKDFFTNDSTLSQIAFIGPSAYAAQLEGSKAFAKKFMQENNIPTANYFEFTKENFQEGKNYLSSCSLPIVLKADGLAAGKGVIIAQSHQEAITAFTEMIEEQKFGTASDKVVIEDFLDGIELSVFVLTDGKNYVLFPNAKDYKRIGEGDTGLNTGGMGAISPVPFADAIFMQKVITKIVAPTIEGIAKSEMDYIGFVFFGLIKVGEEPFVIEYNCRLGDPETEVILPRLENDLVDLFIKAAEGNLQNISISENPLKAATLMLVSGGYPEAYDKNKEIQLTEINNDSMIFHAGTTENDNAIVTNGGRVIAITTLASSLQEATAKNNLIAQEIHFEGKYFRRDIGYEFI